MKRNIKAIYFLAATLGMTSCLKEGDSNIPPSAKGSVMEMLFVQPGGTTINSGLNYFAGAALTYPADHVADTATFVVSLQGSDVMSSDFSVNLTVDADAVNDNIVNDGIDYKLMPDSLYDFMSETAVIKAGERSAEFQVIFYPNKIDATQNYNLPVSATNTANIITSSNFGKIYFHAIGNPIAGAYTWDFTRYENQDGTGTPRADVSFKGHDAVFSPVNPTTVKVPAGYIGAHYLVTFTNTGGVLSDFKAVFDPEDVKNLFGSTITVTSGPTIVVSDDLKTFTIKSVVNSSGNFRNLTEKYYK